MACIDSLIEDHRLISRVLAALDAFTRDASSTSPKLKRDLRRFTTFFKVFCDVHHVTKEEDVLFPYLVHRGASWEGGALSRARDQHRHERYFVGALEHLAAQERAYDAEAFRHLLAELKALQEAMRAHVEFEHASIFEMTKRLSQRHQAELATQLATFDAGAPSVTDIPEMRDLAQRLISDYAPGP